MRASIYRLAFLHLDRDEFDSAEPLFQEAKVCNLVLSESLTELALFYAKEKHFEESRWFYEKSLNAHREEGSYETLASVHVHHNLAEVLKELQKLSLAHSSCEDAIALVEILEGPNSKELLPILRTKLAMSPWHQDLIASNFEITKRILRVSRITYGESHREYANALKLVARFGESIDQRASEFYLQEALQVLKSLPDEDGEEISDVAMALFNLRVEFQNYEGAEEIIRFGLSVREKSASNSCHALGWIEHTLAKFLFRMSRHDEAETSLAHAVSVWREERGPDRGNILHRGCLQDYAGFLRSKNRIPEALVVESELNELVEMTESLRDAETI